ITFAKEYLMKMKKLFIALLLSVFFMGFSQDRQLRKVATIGFMNVENLWDTIQSADYIDGTQSISNPAFHRSIPVDSIPFLEVTEEYFGPWNNEALIGKKVVRLQGQSEEFTPKSGKNYNTSVYKKKLENSARVISELGAQYTNTAP